MKQTIYILKMVFGYCFLLFLSTSLFGQDGVNEQKKAELVCHYLKKQLIKKSKKKRIHIPYSWEFLNKPSHVVFSADYSRCLIKPSSSNKLLFFALKNDRYFLAKEIDSEGYVYTLLSSENKFVVDYSGRIVLFDVETFEEIWRAETNKDWPYRNKLLFSSNGAFLTTSPSSKNILRVFNSETGEIVKEFFLGKMTGDSPRLSWSLDGRFIVLAYFSDEKYIVCDLESGQFKEFPFRLQGGVGPTDIFFNHKGDKLMTFGLWKEVDLWKFKGLEGLDLLFRVVIPDYLSFSSYDAEFSIDDKRFIISFKRFPKLPLVIPPGFECLADASTGKILRIIKGSRDMVKSFSVDGSFCVISDKRVTQFLDSMTGQQIARFRDSGASISVRFNAQGNKMFLAKFSGLLGNRISVDVWDLYIESDMSVFSAIENELTSDQLSLLYNLYVAKVHNDSKVDFFKQEVFDSLPQDVQAMVAKYLLPRDFFSRALFYIKDWLGL